MPNKLLSRCVTRNVFLGALIILASLANNVWSADFFYLNENSVAHARYFLRRLRRRLTGISLVVTFLSGSTDPSWQSDARAAIKADGVATSLIRALEQIAAVGGESKKPLVGTANTGAG